MGVVRNSQADASESESTATVFSPGTSLSLSDASLPSSMERTPDIYTNCFTTLFGTLQENCLTQLNTTISFVTTRCQNEGVLSVAPSRTSG
jgi:hypothetical protein